MNKDHLNKLRELLDRYYAADLTAEEEKKLLELLADQDLPDEFLPDREMMEGMSMLIPRECFEARLSERIDALALNDAGGRHVQVNFHFSAMLRWSVAAAVAVVIAVATLARIISPAPECSQLTPEQTYEQATMALLIFGDAIDKGCNAIEIADSTAADATEKAISALTTIEYYISDN